MASLGNQLESVHVWLRAEVQLNIKGWSFVSISSYFYVQGVIDSLGKCSRPEWVEPSAYSQPEGPSRCCIPASSRQGRPRSPRLGRTVQHWAASSPGENRIVDLLLSNKAVPNATDHEKKAALHLADLEEKADAVTSLMSHRATKKLVAMQTCFQLS